MEIAFRRDAITPKTSTVELDFPGIPSSTQMPLSMDLGYTTFLDTCAFLSGNSSWVTPPFFLSQKRPDAVNLKLIIGV